MTIWATCFTSPPYSFDWSASDPTVLTGLSTTDPTLEAYVGVIYYLTITDSMGCVYEDTFEVDCCHAPLNPHCTYTSVGPTLMWDPVPSATSYEIMIFINDPACCNNPTSPPMSAAYYLRNRHFHTLTTIYPCASWLFAPFVETNSLIGPYGSASIARQLVAEAEGTQVIR